MLSLRKLAKYAAIGGLAMGLITGTGSVSTYAATLNENSFDMDYETNTLKIHVYHDEVEEEAKEGYFDAGEPKYVYLGIGKTDAAIKQYDRFKLSEFDIKENTKKEKIADRDGKNPTDADWTPTYKTTYIYDYYISIPLPTYVSPTIGYAVKAYTDIDTNGAQDAAKTTLAKQTQRLTAQYDPLKQVLTVKADGKDLKVYGESNYDGSSEYEIRTLYGADWEDPASLTEDTLNMYETYGTTLIVRECATTGATGKPASKEVKVKIPKKANGPKAVINPSKMTIQIPNGAEWRIIGSTKRINKITGSDPFIWTATSEKKEGWISNSTKTAQLLDVLQKAVTDAKVVIGQKYVRNLNPALEGSWVDKDDSGKTTNNITQAKKEDIIGNIFESGATIELRMPAKGKKATSKISFYDIPAQHEEIALGDKGVSIGFTLNAKKDDVTVVKVKNGSDSDIEVAFVDSSYDISKVKFTKMTKGSEKNFSKKIAKEGKFLLFRSAAVAVTKSNAQMSLGGVPSTVEIKYPKEAGSFSNYELKNSILTVKSLTAGKGYAYKKSTGEVVAKELGIGPALPGDATIMEIAAGATSVSSDEISGLEKDQYLIVYEYDPATKVIINMASHKIIDENIKKDTPVKPVDPALKSVEIKLSPTTDADGAGKGTLTVENASSDTNISYCYEITAREVTNEEAASKDLSSIRSQVVDKTSGVNITDVLTVSNYIIVYECTTSGDTTKVTGFVSHKVEANEISTETPAS